MLPDHSKIESLLQKVYQDTQKIRTGNVANYIPELSRVDPELFAISITTCDGDQFQIGHSQEPLSLQSMSKPFVYALALSELGLDTVHKHVGVEPTGNAFNSIIELEEQSHRPYNPMINSGAIAVSSLISGQTPQGKFSKLKSFVSAFAGRPLEMNAVVFESENSTAYRNRAILHLMRHFGVIADPIEEALELYFKQCSLIVNARDLSTMAATLAGRGVNPLTHQRVLDEKYMKNVVSLMFTCGMYDSVGEWAFRVGIPAKSGVSGGILGVVPGVMGISVFSPRLDERGHSVRGIAVFEALSQELGLNIFEGHI